MSLKKFFLPLLLVLTTSFLYAVDDETAPLRNDKSLIATPDPTEPQIPKRELKFDISEEEQPLTLDKVQEGMLDQRYVATFRLVLPKVEKSTEKYDSNTSPGKFADPLNKIDNYKTLISVVQGGGMYGFENTSDGRPLKKYAYNLPIYESYRIILYDRSEVYNVIKRQNEVVIQSSKGQYSISFDSKTLPLLDKNLLDSFLTEIFPFMQSSHKSDKRISNMDFYEVRILAPSDKEVKKRVEEWVAIYDNGLCYSAQNECLDLRKKLAQALVKDRNSLEKTEMELSSANKEAEKYKEFDDIKAEAIVSLTTQRRMLAVDLAGIKARINACEEMLAQKAMSAGRKDQIETTLVAAQIELRGLDAKQTEIDRIIQGAQQRQELLAKTPSMKSNIVGLKSTIDRISKAIQELDEYKLGFQPLPVEDNKVTIRRIKWVSPPKSDTPQPQPKK